MAAPPRWVAVTLIDLETPARHQPGEAPVWRMGRALAGRSRREFAAVVVAVLALAVLGGAGVPKKSAFPASHRVGPAANLARYAISDDLLFAAPDDGQSVSAYVLDSGEAVWRLEARQIIFLRAVAGVVIVGVVPVSSAGSGSVVTAVTEVFAVDERTGKRRWTHPGTVAEGSESAALVVLRDGQKLSAYAPATGERVWQRTFGPFATAPIADDPARLLVQKHALPRRGELTCRSILCPQWTSPPVR